MFRGADAGRHRCVARVAARALSTSRRLHEVHGKHDRPDHNPGNENRRVAGDPEDAKDTDDVRSRITWSQVAVN